MLRFLCLFSVIFGVRSALAPFINPCNKGDTTCMKASAQAAIPFVAPGIPELGIKSLDPLQLAVIKGDQSGLQLTFKDTVITGMKNCVIENIKQDSKAEKQTVTSRCSVTMKGNYKLGGQLLVFPIQGEGKYKIDIQDIIIKTVSDITTVQGPDGKPHWHISKRKHTYQVKTGAHFQFDNLFNGNQVLSGTVHSFVNSNWRDVMKEVASPIVKAIVDAVLDVVDSLYKAVPVDELVLQ